MAERTCPECGASMEGRRPHVIYCGRDCQLAAYTRSRRTHAGGRAVVVRLDEDAYSEIARAAGAAAITVSEYVGLIAAAHGRALAEMPEAARG